KETYSGGSSHNYNADCRSNPDQKGDLFSWCAVYRFQDLLCPDGWRVPTGEDFKNLDIALGHTGENGDRDIAFINSHYLETSVWGGNYSGHCGSDSSLRYQDARGLYWSQSEADADTTKGYSLDFGAAGFIYPQIAYGKYSGHTLRCVR
ncbi:MAG: fibrobacter succinogenes major paralogous domain-containing protein, partial [Bacteroidales bacterium]|nr:fibrobacter succinogenes major paralogous domain-containing protein [Bacteroidales bacterium]